MSSKKDKQFCRIFQWVEEKDKDFASAIQHVCMEGALSPKGSPGITLLWPEDKSFRKEVIEKASEGEAEEAVKMIKSLIIPDYFKSLGDFDKRKDAVGSLLGVKYVVKFSGGKASIMDQDGKELELSATKFQTFGTPQHQVLAVYCFKGGRLPLSGAAYERPRAAPRAARGDHGDRGTRGARGAGEAMSQTRAVIADMCAIKYIQYLNGKTLYHPYLAKVVSFLNFLKDKHPDMFITVIPLLDYNPFISFFIMFEPYKKQGTFLVSDEILGEWGAADLYVDAVEEYKGMFALLNAGSAPLCEALVCADNAKVAAAVSKVQQSFDAALPAETCNKVKAAYAAALDNKIDGVSVFPESTLALFKTADWKLCKDECRFILRHKLLNLCGLVQQEQVAEFEKIIACLQTDWSGIDYSKELCLTNEKIVEAIKNSPRATATALDAFISSGDFMYFAKSLESASQTGSDKYELDCLQKIKERTVDGRSYQDSDMVHALGVTKKCLEQIKWLKNSHPEIYQQLL